MFLFDLLAATAEAPAARFHFQLHLQKNLQPLQQQL
jgi:hypothetical protein